MDLEEDGDAKSEEDVSNSGRRNRERDYDRSRGV